MNRVIIVQARMTSRRLPGEVMMDLSGRPVLSQQLRRLKRCRRADEIVVATTLNESDRSILLLTHTSGIPNINDFPSYDWESRFPHTPEQMVAMFQNAPLEFQPGERYSYSNSNYNLLAYVIELASGKSYGDFLKDNIFAPLGMSDTGHDGHPGLLLENRRPAMCPPESASWRTRPASTGRTRPATGRSTRRSRTSTSSTARCTRKSS